MIKSTELMIGDYVLVDGKPRRVESITKKKIGYHINPQTDKRLHYARLHDIAPIDINEEFLKENGFSESRPCGNFNDYGNFSEIIRYLTIFDMNDHIMTSGFYIPNDDGSSTNIGRISMLQTYYLHQLQQTYRLWGIQKDWKL